MTPAWCAQCDSSKGSRCAYGEGIVWTRHVVTVSTLLRRPGNSQGICLTQKLAPFSCTGCARCLVHDMCLAVSNDEGKQGHQDSLWKAFLQDYSRSWDNAHQKSNSPLPDFRHQDLREALWADNCYKAAGVDTPLSSPDARTNYSVSSASPWSLLSGHADQRVGPGFGKRLSPASVTKLCQQGQVKEAVEILEVLVGTNSDIDKHLLYSVLKECVMRKDLMLGGQVHAIALKLGFGSNVFLCNHFIRMYAGHGKLQEAMDVFRGVAVPDTFMWFSIISAHVQLGQAQRALELYQEMRALMTKPNGYVLVATLRACAALGDLEFGKQVHNDVLTSGMERDMFVSSSLVDMYAKCGSLNDARRVFDGLCEKDVVIWNAMLTAYAQQDGMGQQALALYSAMHDEGMAVPNRVTFVCLLQACANMGMSALERGKQLHTELSTRKLESDMVVGGSLVNMYVKCGSLGNARIVFDGLREKNVVTWSAIIGGYSQQDGMGQEALNLYSVMQNEGMVIPDAVTFLCLLQACANVGVSALEKGKQIHVQLKERGSEVDVVVSSCLIKMYAKCGSLKDARILFDRLGEKDVVTWNTMIAGYAKVEGMGQEALALYSAMHNEGMEVPDTVTYVCLLQACANVGVAALEKGKQLHTQLKERGLTLDVVVGGSLVNMYVKCGSLTDARIVFDGLGEKNVVTWNAMITGYAQQEGMGQEAFNLYSAMNIGGMVVANRVTFVSLLQACANVGVSALARGKLLHAQLKERRLESGMVVGGSLVNMYAKCGSLADAKAVFDSLDEKNVVTWNAMISGYVQQEGMGLRALNIYRVMRKEGMVTPDAVTYVCLLRACGSVGALLQGEQLHSQICEGGFKSHKLLGSCLVKMYAECGRLEVSRKVFEGLPVKSLDAWTALLNGYAEHGEGGMAIQCFEALVEQGMQPNEVTYICLLTACSHAGLVDQGLQYFGTMKERHGVEPNDRHYTCMVDLLGRSGHLHRAEQILRASSLANHSVGWTALLTACKSYGDAETGRRCFDHLVKLEPTEATPYVLLGSIYGNAGRWDEVDRVESLRKEARARKMPAKACIEVKMVVHEFTVGEQRSDVAATSKNLNAKVKEGGHIPQTQLVLRAMSEKEKVDALCGHAEKLALAYGLLNIPDGSPLLVIKNLRMCNDCHSSTKVMSRLEKRDIVVRDGHMVHRFQNGACSCQDRP